MSLAVSLVSVVAFAFIFQKPLKRFPVLFYLLALAASGLGMYLTLYSQPNPLGGAVILAFQKGQVAFSFFALIMFTGVFAKNSAIRHYLTPIRAELSIIASILILQHLTLNLSIYMSRFAYLFMLRPSTISSLIFALILMVLLIPLAITSFNFVKKRMSAKAWDTLQKLAYVFFAVIFLHLLGFLLPTALAGTDTALPSVIIYCALLVVYLILRIRRAIIDRKSSKALPAQEQAQEQTQE